MSLGDAGKERRKQIKNLRNRRKELLKRDRGSLNQFYAEQNKRINEENKENERTLVYVR